MDLVYVVDDRDLLVAASPGYFAFAEENCWSGAEASIGESLWDFVAGATMRKVQEALLRRIRETGHPVELPFRCDSPEARREMTIVIEPQAEGRVAFSARVDAERTRPHEALLDPAQSRGIDLIEMCGWCDRFMVGGRWVEVEEAAAELGLTTAANLPGISHGLCSDCGKMLSGA